MIDRMRVGWIGTGVMGAPMCGHLIAAGYDVVVTNRTRGRAEPLIAKGATWRDQPSAVAADADVVITMVGYPADVRAVILGHEGVLTGGRPGSLLIDMTTSEPSLAVEIQAAASEHGIETLDAPVSGGDVGARNASLVAMVGGKENAFRRAKPLLERMCRLVVHEGPAGAGQHVKVMNQVAIAGGMIGMCEALLYAYQAGVDIELALQTISDGAAGSWSLSNYGPRALNGDFNPGFKIDHFLKDLGIALTEARRMNLSLPGLALAEHLYRTARTYGFGQNGTHALLLALARVSEVEWDPPRSRRKTELNTDGRQG